MKFLMRRRDVIEEAMKHGVTEYSVNEAIRTGALPKKHLTGGNCRAHYQREDVVRVFGLGNVAGVAGKPKE